MEVWADLVKSSIDQAEDLAKGMWNSCSDILEEWGIAEIKESIEYITLKIKAVEWVRVASTADIQDLAVVDSKAIHFSLISPAQLATWVDEHNRISKKGIKEVAGRVIQGRLHSRLTNGREAEEVIEVNNKWDAWEKSIGKKSVV